MDVVNFSGSHPMHRLDLKLDCRWVCKSTPLRKLRHLKIVRRWTFFEKFRAKFFGLMVFFLRKLFVFSFSSKAFWKSSHCEEWPRGTDFGSSNFE